MNAMTAMRQYQSVNTQAKAVDASPHRLIQMLMEGDYLVLPRREAPWIVARLQSKAS